MLKKLKLNSDQFSGQLQSRLDALERERLAQTEKLTQEGQARVAQLHLASQKRADHIKYFNEHVLQKLKLGLDKAADIEQQLQARLQTMQTETDQKVMQLEQQRRQEVQRIDQDNTKRLQHIKYFHDHIVTKLNLRTQDFEQKLKSRLALVQNELELKNKLLEGTAIPSDVEKFTTANNQILFEEKDCAIRALTQEV